MNFTLIIDCTKEDLVDIFNILVNLNILDFSISKVDNECKYIYYIVEISTRDVELLAQLSTALSNKL